MGEIKNLHYVPGCEPDGSEFASFTLELPDGTEADGGIMAGLLLEAGLRRLSIPDVELDAEQVMALCRFIRHNRDAIKFNNKKKTVEEWLELGIPLEDYGHAPLLQRRYYVFYRSQ